MRPRDRFPPTSGYDCFLASQLKIHVITTFRRELCRQWSKMPIGPLISINASSGNAIECGCPRQLVQSGLDTVNTAAVRVEKLRLGWPRHVMTIARI